MDLGGQLAPLFFCVSPLFLFGALSVRARFFACAVFRARGLRARCVRPSWISRSGAPGLFFGGPRSPQGAPFGLARPCGPTGVRRLDFSFCIRRRATILGYPLGYPFGFLPLPRVTWEGVAVGAQYLYLMCTVLGDTICCVTCGGIQYAAFQDGSIWFSS